MPLGRQLNWTRLMLQHRGGRPMGYCSLESWKTPRRLTPSNWHPQLFALRDLCEPIFAMW